MNPEAWFLAAFRAGDVAAAQDILAVEPAVAAHTDYQAHPLLRACVVDNDGHCYKPAHLAIAELPIPEAVRTFRDAVVADQLDDVRDRLRSDRALVSAEFTDGRGIAQAVHHWRSVAVAELLLDAGADIDAQASVRSNGETPLAMKLRFGSEAGVRFLLERGADPNRGPIKFMPSASMPALVALLLEHGWNINEGDGHPVLPPCPSALSFRRAWVGVPCPSPGGTFLHRPSWASAPKTSHPSESRSIPTWQVSGAKPNQSEHVNVLLDFAWHVKYGADAVGMSCL